MSWKLKFLWLILTEAEPGGLLPLYFTPGLCVKASTGHDVQSGCTARVTFQKSRYLWFCRPSVLFNYMLTLLVRVYICKVPFHIHYNISTKLKLSCHVDMKRERWRAGCSTGKWAQMFAPWTQSWFVITVSVYRCLSTKLTTWLPVYIYLPICLQLPVYHYLLSA